MGASVGYVKWSIPEAELEQLDVCKARDLIRQCFFEAKKETFERARRLLGQVPSDEEIKLTVEGAVRLAFKECDGRYEAPTREDLAGVVGILARKSANWGTPEDIVDHHRGQIQKVLVLLDRKRVVN
jgi:hypothetical protein